MDAVHALGRGGSTASGGSRLLHVLLCGPVLSQAIRCCEAAPELKLTRCLCLVLLLRCWCPGWGCGRESCRECWHSKIIGRQLAFKSLQAAAGRESPRNGFALNLEKRRTAPEVSFGEAQHQIDAREAIC